MAVRDRPVLVGDLRLVRLIGTGGEGEVWEARDGRGRRRALKLIRPEMLAGEDEVSRRGAHLRRIDHPALVRVHRSGVLATPALFGWGFIEMDFVDGRSLASAAAAPDWTDRLRPLAEALDLLHAGAWSDGVPLVHRDVKPANLVESVDGTIVLVDCSTLRGADSTQLTRIGTPVFAAPEVVTGRFGPAADVYSFAATVVALVTGARGDALLELLADPGSAGLPETLSRALSPWPGQRPGSCLSVLGAAGDDWLPVVASEPDWLPTPPFGSVTPEVTTEPDGTPPSRRVWPWTLLLAGMAAIALGEIGGAAAIPATRPLSGSPAVWVGLAAVHLVAHAAARRSLLVAILAPPVSWAWLLAARLAPPGRRRAWAEVVLTGVLLPGFMIIALAAAAPAVVDRSTAAVGVGLAAVLVAAVPLGCRSAAGGIIRFLLLPVWAVGAALLLGAAVLALPLSVLSGRPGVALRAVGRTLGSLAGVARQGEPATGARTPASHA